MKDCLFMSKRRSTSLLRACTYTIGGVLMLLAVLGTALAGLGLAASLLAIPAIHKLHDFTICFHHHHLQDQDDIQAVGMSTSSPGCTSSADIIRKIEDGAALKVLTIAFSIAMLVGLLKISFISVLLHGLTSLQAKLVKIFCIYYAVFLGLATIFITVLIVMFGFTHYVISNMICLPLDVLCLFVINRYRTDLFVNGGFTKM